MTSSARTHLGITAFLLLSGCYLSHGRDARSDGGGDHDAGRDAGRPDAGTTVAGDPDAGRGICVGVRLAEQVVLDGPASVTPRLVALPGGDVGVVHVSTDGSPIRVRFDRLDRALAPRSATTVATDSFTWAEPVDYAGALFIAYGLAGDEGSVLQPITADGEPRGERTIVPLPNPSVLRPWRDGLFWLAFDMRTDNQLVLAHLDRAGALIHPPVEIFLGRYGSGHGAIARPDGRSHVVTYPREGPPGVRESYVNALDAAGALGPERQLSEDGDDLVRPVRQDDRLVLVQHGDALILEVADFDTLATIERHTFPPRGSSPFLVGALGGRVLVGHVADGLLSMDDFGFDLATEHARLTARPPRGRVNGPSGSTLEVPGALYVAVTVIEDGIDTHSMIVRFVCELE